MNRRQMLAASATGVAGSLILWPRAAAGTRVAPTSHEAHDPPEFRAAVEDGVNYFRSRCDDQIPLTRKLIDACASGDLRAAQHAYIESRPPYEEIETLAYAFEDSDRDIDARPYAFEAGESSDDFRGFHKIEAFLFAVEDVGAALPYAKRLHESVMRLRRELADLSRFNAAGQFGGMITLSTEVAAKKISSEEETWSDQTLLIFRHNWIGIHSQYRPFAAIVDARSPSHSAKVKSAFDAAMDLVLPHFRNGTAAATPYSRIRMRERRRMADASMRLRDTILQAAEIIEIEA